MKSWDKYYARNLTLPVEAATRGFLCHLPTKARVLDFGSGNGVWAAAFHRDRPDLAIDLIDQNAADPSLIPTAWKGTIYQSDFLSFQPTQSYDGIWANNSLFFLPTDDIGPVFHKIATTLTSHGVIDFSMLKAGVSAASAQASLSLLEIESLLKTERLAPLAINLDENVEYMLTAGRRKIPTFYVQAKKIALDS